MGWKETTHLLAERVGKAWTGDLLPSPKFSFTGKRPRLIPHPRRKELEPAAGKFLHPGPTYLKSVEAPEERDGLQMIETISSGVKRNKL